MKPLKTLKTFAEFLNERSAPSNKTELKIGEVYDGCVYLGEFKGHNYYVVPRGEEQKLPWIVAIEYCNHLTFGGHSDFFLPDTEELYFAYEQHYDYSVNFDGYYWSSSNYSDNSAHCLNFSRGYQFTERKTNSEKVRAFRKEII